MCSNVRTSIVLCILLFGVGVALAAEVIGTSVANFSVSMIRSKKATKVGTATVGGVETSIYCKSNGEGFSCYAQKPDGTRIPSAGQAKIVRRSESFQLSVPLRGGTTVKLDGVEAAKIEHDCCTIITSDGTNTTVETYCPCPE
jgi:hypothetical protein